MRLVQKNAKLKESDLAVKQDLDILIKQAELNFRNEDFKVNKKVSFLNATGMVFGGLQILLDALGTKFNQQRFHDFILSQGILPPALIREAVMNEFVPKEKSKGNM